MSRHKRILVSSCVRRNIVVYDATMERAECRVGDGTSLRVQRLSRYFQYPAAVVRFRFCTPATYFHRKHPLFRDLCRDQEGNLMYFTIDRYLFVMKSRRASRSLFHGSYGEPDSRMLATLPLRMHGEQIVNNTKQPRQTNIAFGFTGDTRVLVALLPHGKLLYRANTPPYSLSLSLSLSLSRRLVGRDATSEQ
ncbi:hypothetical protein ALC56_06741 [Trachymyrmex septentrionalis]|uniref:Uncharacterized protein n=1 Tax=Trachymyrmex septentrionalis TaxID=34720 RepID=A0A195FEU4_9HYME|nr:hypothetical protein ALC56_06741 [Trachymyrmex septentrionalis]